MTLRELKSKLDELPELALDYDVAIDTGEVSGPHLAEAVYAQPIGVTIPEVEEGDRPCVVIVAEVWQ
jgi:hypothetical protein